MSLLLAVFLAVVFVIAICAVGRLARALFWTFVAFLILIWMLP